MKNLGSWEFCPHESNYITNFHQADALQSRSGDAQVAGDTSTANVPNWPKGHTIP